MTTDLVDVEALQARGVDLAALARQPTRKLPRHRQGEKFLKGPIPWDWLERAFPLSGKALHVALLLWREAGCRRSRVVVLCLAGELPAGLNRQSARRGLRRLAAVGLVSIRQRPGRGLEVTLNEAPAGNLGEGPSPSGAASSKGQSPSSWGDCGYGKG
jgi:hypothetical protein